MSRTVYLTAVSRITYDTKNVIFYQFIKYVYTLTFNLGIFYIVGKYNYLLPKKYYLYIFLVFEKKLYFFQNKKCLENPRNT